ncbi:MAG: hypothetical protein AB1781_10780 [Pseudomonadota bacterium]
MKAEDIVAVQQTGAKEAGADEKKGAASLALKPNQHQCADEERQQRRNPFPRAEHFMQKRPRAAGQQKDARGKTASKNPVEKNPPTGLLGTFRFKCDRLEHFATERITRITRVVSI